MGGGEFDREEAARGEVIVDLREEGADEVETIGTRSEGGVGLVVFDIGFDGVPLVVGDVGRVGDDGVEGRVV